MTLKYFRQYLLNRQIAALRRQSISGDLHVLMEEEEAEKADKTDQDDIEHERVSFFGHFMYNHKQACLFLVTISYILFT